MSKVTSFNLKISLDATIKGRVLDSIRLARRSVAAAKMELIQSNKPRLQLNIKSYKQLRRQTAFKILLRHRLKTLLQRRNNNSRKRKRLPINGSKERITILAQVKKKKKRRM